MKQLSGDSFSARCLARLSALVCAHPHWFIWPQAILLAACVYFTFTSLKFSTSRDALVGENETYHRNFLRLKREFPYPEPLVVLVESANADRRRTCIELIAARLIAEPGLFQDVFFRLDHRSPGAKSLLFMPEEDLRNLRESLRRHAPLLQDLASASNLPSLFEGVNRQFLAAANRAQKDPPPLLDALPALERILTAASNALEFPVAPTPPGLPSLLSGDPGADSKSYLAIGGNRVFLLTARAPSARLNDDAVVRMRQVIESIQPLSPGVNISLTGEPVLDFDELRQSQRDTMLASVVSVVICALIFIFGYHEIARPLKATLCLLVGLGYTMGYATLSVGHLNILTITFLPMLIGLAIDFGIHLVTRFEEELRLGQTSDAAMAVAMVYTGKGIFTGALTTAAGFLAMAFTRFKGIQEMGLICGGGLLICLVPMMTLLPALLSSRGRSVPVSRSSRQNLRSRIERTWLNRPWTTAGVCAALCALSLPLARRVGFDYNLLKMQSPGVPSVVAEHKLFVSSSKSVIYGAILATNLDHAAAMEAQLRMQPSVASVDSIASLLLEKPEPKLEIVSALKTDLAGLDLAEPDRGPLSLSDLSQSLYSLQGLLGVAMNIARGEAGGEAVAARLAVLREKVAGLRIGTLAGDSADQELRRIRLERFQQLLFGEFRDSFRSLLSHPTLGRLGVEDLPKPLLNRFVGRNGLFLLQIYPRKDIWQRENQQEMIREMRAVDPNATGTPVQQHEYTSLLKRSYEEAAWYSLAAICIMVLIHFHNPLAVVLALLPVGIGSLWMLGLMGLFGVSFNPANIMTLPLVIGIGVTNGVHILNRFSEELHPAILDKSTGKAVLVSGLTTIAGFGSLVLACHQGIKSLGLVMALGTACCMLAALAFLPSLLGLLRIKFRLINNPVRPTNGQHWAGRNRGF